MPSRNNGDFFGIKFHLACLQNHTSLVSKLQHLYQGLCIKTIVACILMSNNLLITHDRFTELTCFGDREALFQTKHC